LLGGDMPPQNPNFAVTGIAHLQGESICRAPQRARPFAPVTGNLEASVRSRDNEIAAGTQRDLIEAGLSEPAGGGRGYGDYVCGARSKARHWRRRVTILGD